VDQRIKSFTDFVKHSINEGDGFGTYPFLFRRDGDLYYYFFQLDMEKGGQKGYFLAVGKYSEFENLEGAKNSHAVLNVNEIASEIIEDIAINKENLPEINDSTFKLEGNNLSRFFEQISKCLSNYLEKNPKVVRIVDEMNQNLEVDNYLEYAKSMLISELGPEWSMQEGSHKGVFILSR
jgi:hypothetical protein